MKLKLFRAPLQFLLALLLFMAACTKEKEYKIPDAVSDLKNDLIKRSLGPNIVGIPIEFAYAMALPKSQGKLISAEVEASIAGGTGTFLENNSYNTASTGVDVPVRIGTPSVNDANKTRVTFNVDTNAATLRYYYVVPAEARGKTVSFTFSASSSDGKTVSTTAGPYSVSNMDIVRNLRVSNALDSSYISIADMTVYNRNNVAANAGKIDLIYLFRATPSAFLHALVSPAADAQYLPGVTLPAGVNRSTKIMKTFNVGTAPLDWNLHRPLPFLPGSPTTYAPATATGTFIDDKDFQALDLSTAPNYATGLRAEAGVWVETADGKYRAYIFLNSVSSGGSAVISMLRYTVQ